MVPTVQKEKGRRQNGGSSNPQNRVMIDEFDRRINVELAARVTLIMYLYKDIGYKTKLCSISKADICL